MLALAGMRFGPLCTTCYAGDTVGSHRFSPSFAVAAAMLALARLPDSGRILPRRARTFGVPSRTLCTHAFHRAIAVTTAHGTRATCFP